MHSCPMAATMVLQLGLHDCLHLLLGSSQLVAVLIVWLQMHQQGLFPLVHVGKARIRWPNPLVVTELANYVLTCRGLEVGVSGGFREHLVVLDAFLAGPLAMLLTTQAKQQCCAHTCMHSAPRLSVFSPILPVLAHAKPLQGIVSRVAGTETST